MISFVSRKWMPALKTGFEHHGSHLFARMLLHYASCSTDNWADWCWTGTNVTSALVCDCKCLLTDLCTRLQHHIKCTSVLTSNIQKPSVHAEGGQNLETKPNQIFNATVQMCGLLQPWEPVAHKWLIAGTICSISSNAWEL